jgi:flagellar motor switch protein FliG
LTFTAGKRKIIGGGILMVKGKSIVITTYGHEKTIDRIAVSLFDETDAGYYNNDDKNAKTYCDTINNLELKGDSWIIATIVSENKQYSLDNFLSVTFDLILKMDDRSLQKVLRETHEYDFAIAIKNENEEIKEKVFRNLSRRASLMLKENLEILDRGSIRAQDIRAAQERILNIVYELERRGEIVITREGQ